ncbi:MAG TPA: zinc ribbon domain-containing protein [Roseiflexaceae bacterium]|nr:zinc ribbon domain-containing protein [Roseiflexaceae bacterium]
MKTHDTISCAQCANENPTSASFCITCGAPLPAPATGATVHRVGPLCPACGHENIAGAAQCSLCYATLAPLASIPTPAPVPAANQAARLIGQLLVLLAVLGIFTPLRLWPGVLLLVGLGAFALPQPRLRIEIWLPLLVIVGGVTIMLLGGVRLFLPGILLLVLLAFAISRWR